MLYSPGSLKRYAKVSVSHKMFAQRAKNFSGKLSAYEYCDVGEGGAGGSHIKC